MNLIQSNSSSLNLAHSNCSAYFGLRSMEQDLCKHLEDPVRKGPRCEIFVWNFHRHDEPSNYITSYDYDSTQSEEKEVSVSELFFETLWVREYPDNSQEIIEHPFRGLVTSARTSNEFHNTEICVSFRVPARDDRETQSELDALQDMGVKFHFPFIIPEHDTERNTRHNAAYANQTMLEAAAGKLAEWFIKGSEKMSEAGTVTELNNPGSERMGQAETIVEWNRLREKTMGKILTETPNV